MHNLSKQLGRYLMITAGCFLMAVAVNIFCIPYDLLSGGLSGYCVLLYYLCGWSPSFTNMLLNVPLFAMAYKMMSRDYFLSGIYGTVIFSFFLQATAYLSQLLVVKDTLLACIAGGVLSGIGAAMLYRVGGNSGGVDIIGAIIQKHYSISIGTTEFIGNVALMVLGCYFSGVEPTLYTLLSFFVAFKTCNAFTDGFDYKKSFIIISKEHEAIGEAIMAYVGRGVTYLQGQGGYTRQMLPVVFVVAKLTQVAKIKAIVKEHDPFAFMIIQDASDVLGRGFTERDVHVERPQKELRMGWHDEMNK